MHHKWRETIDFIQKTTNWNHRGLTSNKKSHWVEDYPVVSRGFWTSNEMLEKLIVMEHLVFIMGGTSHRQPSHFESGRHLCKNIDRLPWSQYHQWHAPSRSHTRLSTCNTARYLRTEIAHECLATWPTSLLILPSIELSSISSRPLLGIGCFVYDAFHVW